MCSSVSKTWFPPASSSLLWILAIAGTLQFESLSLAFAVQETATQTQSQTDKQPFDKGQNTQVETISPLTDAQALASWELPENFQLNLFASAPSISQPIAATFDTSGRLWLAENYTYAERPLGFERKLFDRVLVLTDEDGDGTADQTKVFWDKAKLLSSVEVGMGGVWLLCAPELIFIPDADNDAVPDGPPQVILDGFNDQEVGHNLVNGLRWGPDGWLYGRHGIQANSYVGMLGTAKEKRIPLNCCIWRYHPTLKKFEIVCQGTTNSWGHDWDENGQLFFINTVIGHFWHGIPGSHFERMYGEDLAPNLFELIQQTADHVHWDQNTESWQQQRMGMTSGTDAAGGGHAHSGLMFYLGDRWPKEYQGDVFTLNFHGRRFNREHIQPEGATFTAVHRPDMLETNDQWFRGIDLITGPDGAVYFLDWSDIGECHENDGVHRTSGRIYRVDYARPGTPAAKANPATMEILAGNNLLALAGLVSAPNSWVRRMARLRIQEVNHQANIAGNSNAASTKQAAVELLRRTIHTADVSWKRTQAINYLWAMDQLDTAELTSLLAHSDPHVRIWATRLLSDGVNDPSSLPADGLNLAQIPKTISQTLVEHAANEEHGLVLTYFAAAMRLMSNEERWAMAKTLLQHSEFAADRVFPLMVWYGIEPAIAGNRDRISELLAQSKLPRVDQFIARRLAIEHTFQAGALDELTGYLANNQVALSQQIAVIKGIADGLRGWNQLTPPTGWQALSTTLKIEDSPAMSTAFSEATLAFGNSRSLNDLVKIAGNGQQPLDVRRPTIQALARSLNLSLASQEKSTVSEQEQAAAKELLLNLLSDRFLGETAAASIGLVNDLSLQTQMLNQFSNSHPNAQNALITTLCQRASTATLLLDAVEANSISKESVTPYLLRQMQLLGQATLNQTIVDMWPENALIQGDRLKQNAALQTQLSDENLANADLVAGHGLFTANCAKCHRLFGQGERLGPDLTGSQRNNKAYWLQNILAPSAEVGEGFRMSIILLTDGRTLSGVITEKNVASFKLTTQTDVQLVRLDDVEEIRQSDQSLMPEGLLDSLTEKQKIDLFGYLMVPDAPAFLRK